MIVSDKDTQAKPEPNMDIERTEGGNLIVRLDPQQFSSPVITQVNIDHLKERIGEAVSEMPRTHAQRAQQGANLNVIFDATELHDGNIPRGGLTNLGKLLTKTNTYMTQRGFRDNVELISRDAPLNEAMRVTGMATIVKVTNPDAEPTLAGGRGR